MSTVINLVAFAIAGGLLGANGMPYNTWQFWVFMTVLVAIRLNSGESR